MAVDQSVPAHTRAANNNNNNNNNNNSGNTSSPASTLTHEYLYRYSQRQQHHRPTTPLQPICTALPRYNNNDSEQQQQRRDHHDDTPTTATADNNSNAQKGINLSEPGTARTLFSPNGDGDLGFHHNKYAFPSHNPFDDPSTFIDNNSNDQIDPSLPSTLQPQTDQHQPEKQQPQQAWTNGRHPIAHRKYLALYTRLFRLNTIPATHSSQIVHSTWLPTGALFSIRMVLFLYSTCVLTADIIQTERIRYEFCYLTQLSYLGLISYLGTVSWHTFSEWRRERGLRAINATSSSCQDKELGASASEAAVAELLATQPTTIERQHWFLTDMIFFLYHTICTFHVIIPILYWGYLSYSGEAHMMAVDIKPEAKWRNFSFHGGDIILVLIEISINAMPFIPSHFLVVLGICLLYLGEAHVVYKVDGFWLYPFLDTNVGPIWVAMYLGVGFLIACAFASMYFLHRWRNWVITRRAAGKVLRDAESSSSSSSSSEDAPEMVVVSSSVPVTSLYSYNNNTLPTGTILVSTDYDHSNSSNHHHPIYTHTNTSTALFPTAAPPTTILATTSTATSTPFQPSPQPLSIPLQTQILIQSRRRSYSNCSNDSTTSTLVGSDEGMATYKKGKELEGEEVISERTARRLSMPVPPQTQPALEKVDEEDHDTTDAHARDQ